METSTEIAPVYSSTLTGITLETVRSQLIPESSLKEKDIIGMMHISSRVGHCESLRVACYAAALRVKFFNDTPELWIEKMEKEFGYQRRMSFRHLKVGKFILEVLFGVYIGDPRYVSPMVQKDLQQNTEMLKNILSLSLAKLEMLAEIQPELVSGFMKKHPDCTSISRDEFSDRIDFYRAQGEHATDKEKKRALAKKKAAETSASKKQPSYQISKAVQALVKLEEHIGADDKLDTVMSMRAAFHLQQAVLNRYETEPVTNEELAKVRDTLQQELELVEKLMKS